MNPGQVLILITFAASLGAAWFFFSSSKEPPGKGRRPAVPGSPAVKLYVVRLISVALSSALLYYHILTHSFDPSH